MQLFKKKALWNSNNNEVFNHTRHWNFLHLFILLILTCLCYWPLTFGVFSAKNDNITQFLPVRFHVSEALRHGHLPLWTPYMYLGYPIHGDMQGGAWNPVVWFLSIFGRYNATSLHVEILISIFLSGAGMYRLLGIKNFTALSKLVGAGAYLMCGFITDVAGSNLPFLWGAAYVPFDCAYYAGMLRAPSTKSAFKTAIFLSLLFVSAYPSFFILTGYIFFAAFIVNVSSLFIKKNYVEIKSLLKYNIVTVLAFVSISAAAVISYLHILPYYHRVGGVSLKQAFENNFDLFCTWSFFLPTFATKGYALLSTDLISRNAYFNLLLFLFLCTYLWNKKTPLTHFVFTGIIFFFLFSLGSSVPLRELCYRFLPLMNTFRHPANARLFVIVGSIFLSVYCINNFQGSLSYKYLKYVGFAFLLASLAIIIFFLFHLREFLKIQQVLSLKQNFHTADLKSFLDNLSSGDVMLMNSAIQFVFIMLFLFLIKKRKANNPFFAGLLLLNSFVFAQNNIPFTAVSKLSPSVVNSIIKTVPHGYPAPSENNSIQQNSIDTLPNQKEIGIREFYSKKIAFTTISYTPTFMVPVEKMLSDSFAKKIVLSNPYAYVVEAAVESSASSFAKTILTKDKGLLSSKKNVAEFNLTRFWNNGFEFQINASDSTVFCLQQLFLPGWVCTIDRERIYPALVNTAFMAIQVPKGIHTIRFVYTPLKVIIGFWISIISCISLLFPISFLKRKQKNFKRI